MDKTSEIQFSSGAKFPVAAVTLHYTGILYIHFPPSVSGESIMAAFSAPGGPGGIIYGSEIYTGYKFDSLVNQGDHLRLALTKE